MSFNSFTFLGFLTAVFLVYWASSRNFRLQNLIVLFASYVFYGWWDVRFLILLFATSLVDYICGQRIHDSNTVRRKRLYLLLSLVSNLSVLAFFKYFNFFLESFTRLCISLGWHVNTPFIQIILPVGISFYTFQSLSYTIDIYRGKIKPAHDPVAFFAFISFFPQLVAGPIERAEHLLGQFLKSRHFDQKLAKDGLCQMLWGFFKKIVIADRLALHVEAIFSDPASLNSTDLTLGIIFFSYQIYCDFSGYSDIAIGTARLFGFELMRNFRYPYFSRNLIEFWQRWHISLSTWFRDYVYIPLGGNKGSPYQHRRNIVLTFLLSGLWHGANWTFVYWGGLHALYYILALPGFKRDQAQKEDSGFVKFLEILVTFILVGIGWVFFRSADIQQAFVYFWGLFQLDFQPIRDIQRWDLILLTAFIVVEFIQRDKAHGLELRHLPVWGRWLIYFVVCLLILALYVPSQQFIYFQF